MVIIIEASNIYFGGGYVLLVQILNYCENHEIKTQVFIGYEEVFIEINKKKFKNIEVLKTNTFSTLIRYTKQRSNILFFCNLPPFVKNDNAILYAHNILFFKLPNIEKTQSIKFNLKKFLYFFWIKHFSKNVQIIACQTEDVKKALSENLSLKASLFPFYEIVKPIPKKKLFDFCYVSSAPPHKNHKRLIEAISYLSERYNFKIALTIAEAPKNKALLNTIKEINNKHSREIITNIGFLSNEKVVEIYSTSCALVFPSLEETIALPLIEAIQCGLIVLSADRPYTHQVIENPITFDAFSSKSIADTMEDFLLGKYDGHIQNVKVPNRLKDLVELLQNNYVK